MNIIQTRKSSLKLFDITGANMSEVKPKEFWLREEYKNDKYEFFSCEIATRKPNLESHNESDFKDALHVIEYSAYEKLKAQLEKAESVLNKIQWLGHPERATFKQCEGMEIYRCPTCDSAEQAREYFK